MSFSLIENLRLDASSRSRRTAIAGISGATLATLMSRASADARKAGKKARKKCRKQITQCEEAISTVCPEIARLLQIAPDACRAAMLPCCTSFDGCRAGTAITCLYEAAETLQPIRPEL